jgi:hypothetical protein
MTYRVQPTARAQADVDRIFHCYPGAVRTEPRVGTKRSVKLPNG